MWVIIALTEKRIEFFYFKGKNMDTDSKMGFAVIMGALIILLGIIIGGVHNEKLQNDCKLAGIQKGYSAVEVQAICNRR